MVQGSCTAVDPVSRAGQNFCGSDDRCRNHDETAWCAESTLSPCPLLRPTIGGDCKLAGNLFAQFGNSGAASRPAAIAAGVHFGPSAICLGVPGGRFARRGVSAWRLSETCFASRCADAETLLVLIKDADGDGVKEYLCPEGEFLVLPVEDGFEEGVRARPGPRDAHPGHPHAGACMVYGRTTPRQAMRRRASRPSPALLRKPATVGALAQW